MDCDVIFVTNSVKNDIFRVIGTLHLDTLGLYKSHFAKKKTDWGSTLRLKRSFWLRTTYDVFIQVKRLVDSKSVLLFFLKRNLAKRVAEIENKSFHYFKNNSFLNPVDYKIITQNK